MARSRRDRGIPTLDEDVDDLDAFLDEDDPADHEVHGLLRAVQPLRGAGWRPAPLAVKPRLSSWRQAVAGVERSMQGQAFGSHTPWPANREILYVVDVASALAGQGLRLEIFRRDRKRNGEWRRAVPLQFSAQEIAHLPDPDDRQILAQVVGADTSYGSYRDYGWAAGHYQLWGPLIELVLPLLGRTKRCCLRTPHPGELLPVGWDDGEPWAFWLQVDRDASARHYRIMGSLRRGAERMPLADPVLLLAGGFVFTRERIARLDDGGAFGWISQLREHGALRVPLGQHGALIESVLRLPEVPRLDLPAELAYEEVRVAPRPRLRIRRNPNTWEAQTLLGELSFDYDGVSVPAEPRTRGVFRADARRLLVREPAAEQACAERLHALGFRRRPGPDAAPRLGLAQRRLPAVVRALVAAGWAVEADGKLYRQSGAFQLEVSSGIDWFELHGGVEFGDQVVGLPALLAAARRGEGVVPLDDGTFGMLPEEWLRRYGGLAGLGTSERDHLRFTRHQVGLLDALLASRPEARCDAVFDRARDQLARFDGVQPHDAPAGFVGRLRGYQRDGLGWLHFLQAFGFGGCLADDMGLGKTVMVLALLASRRAEEPHRGPSLVVVPRSLVFNWCEEALRFTPALRVLDHTGVDRTRGSRHFGEYDVVLTTYGTLRRDVGDLVEARFDYVVLDEAQVIKNPDTDAAKAARLLSAEHRLVLSGTPIENHLGDLWSLFEFLNPAMLGTASAFSAAGAGARSAEESARPLLARALRPFILRRTKEQVLRDLPPKSEQTLYCELEPAQRVLYDELRDHYRRSLLGRVDADGLGRVKILVLEALLRLRQAACHVGLVDRARVGEPSGKLDVLLPRLAEVLDEGHKALVFSQFTSHLAIVRARLDRERIPYEYLDGATRDRAARVTRFQEDPACRLFLVSLKAGGLGLNLTAAEYVFLLDPWWNPAVEAQAVDRSHRIGQTRPVFAYRLIARGTVEEKVLELQQRKRALVGAIITDDNSLIRTLSRQDLELLLS